MLIIRCATLNVITTSTYAMLTERNPVELPLVDVGDLVVVPADRRTRGRLKDVPAKQERPSYKRAEMRSRRRRRYHWRFSVRSSYSDYAGRGSDATSGGSQTQPQAQPTTCEIGKAHARRFIPASEVFFRRAKWENKGGKNREMPRARPLAAVKR